MHLILNVIYILISCWIYLSCRREPMTYYLVLVLIVPNYCYVLALMGMTSISIEKYKMTQSKIQLFNSSLSIIILSANIIYVCYFFYLISN